MQKVSKDHSTPIGEHHLVIMVAPPNLQVKIVIMQCVAKLHVVRI